MKIIKAKFVDGVLTPAEPLPTNRVRVEHNGTDFVVYESQDEIMYGGTPYEAKPLKYQKARNLISRIQGFFIRLSHKIRESKWLRRLQ